jgi:hypothetical protein
MDETEASTADPTAASPQAADALTDLHEPIKAEPTLAYSDEPDDDREPGHRRGWFVVPVFVAALVAFAVAAAAGCLLWIGSYHNTSHPTVAAPVSTKPASPPGEPPAAPPSAANPAPSLPPPPPTTATATKGPSPSKAELDSIFLGALSRGGIAVSDYQATIRAGHLYCERAVGHSDSETVQEVMRDNPELTLDNARTFITTAKNAYCPGLG